MKMVHAITNGEDPSEIDIGGGGEDDRKLKERKLKLSQNIGKLGAMDKNSKAAELQKMIQENNKLAKGLGKDTS